jgi:hypothetical protein
LRISESDWFEIIAAEEDGAIDAVYRGDRNPMAHGTCEPRREFVEGLSLDLIVGFIVCVECTALQLEERRKRRRRKKEEEKRRGKEGKRRGGGGGG